MTLRRLIWIFARRTCPKVCFLTSRLVNAFTVFCQWIPFLSTNYCLLFFVVVVVVLLLLLFFVFVLFLFFFFVVVFGCFFLGGCFCLFCFLFCIVLFCFLLLFFCYCFFVCLFFSEIKVFGNCRLCLMRLNISVLFKGSMFLKNIYSFIQERFNKLIYGINTIINTCQPVKFQLVSRSWNEMIFIVSLN